MDSYGDPSGTTSSNNAIDELSRTPSSNNIIDEPLRVTPLPHDHPIFKLGELRDYSMSDNHRLFSARGRTVLGARKFVVLAHDGKRPLNHTVLESCHYTELVAREWIEGQMCWTVDLNGKRYAVNVTLGGGYGGATYRPWQGKETKFDGRPVAFKMSQAAQLARKEYLDHRKRTSGIPLQDKSPDRLADQCGHGPRKSTSYPFGKHGDYTSYRSSSDDSDSETEIPASNSRLGLVRRTSECSDGERTCNEKRVWTAGQYWPPVDKSNAMG